MGFTFTKSGNVTTVDGPGLTIKTKSKAQISYDTTTERIKIAFGEADNWQALNIKPTDIDEINSAEPDSDIEVLLQQLIVAFPDQDARSNSAAAIVPSDEDDIPATIKGVYVGGSGTIVAIINGAVVTFTGAQAGTILPIETTRINDTGTTATGLIALY
jgi:hypothetical protein